MDQKTIKTKSDADLTKALSDAREELRKLRFGVGGVKDPREKDKHKTLVARIMTELRARKA